MRGKPQKVPKTSSLHQKPHFLFSLAMASEKNLTLPGIPKTSGYQGIPGEN